MYTCTNTSYLALLLEKSMRILYKFSMLCFFLLFLRKKYVLNFFLFLQCLDSNYYHYYNNKFRTSTRTHSCWVFFSSTTKLLAITCQSFQLTAFLFIGWKCTKKRAQTHSTYLSSTQIVCKTKRNKTKKHYNTTINTYACNVVCPMNDREVHVFRKGKPVFRVSVLNAFCLWFWSIKNT